jgi:AcrR family transcriptional regulator
MKTTRQYVMRARAAAAEETRLRILRAAIEAVDDKPIAAMVLSDVADRADVSVQTVLRQFGSRDGLLDAATELAAEEIAEERATPPGDVDGAVRVLFDHYEARGDGAIRLLAQESWDERARSITATGRAVHRRWVEDVFAPLVADRTDGEQTELLDLLVVATDVYTWKLLRRDRDLSRAAAQRRVLRMINSILGR